MRRFIKNFGLFMIPVFAVIGIFMTFYITGYVSGEFLDSDVISNMQRADHGIVAGLGYNENTPYYKLCNANYEKADVLVLGTSRCMQFKSDYFTESMYNCGGAVHGNYREYINFLKNLDEDAMPRVMILDLDSWVFNDAWNSAEKDYTEFVPIEPDERNKIVMAKQMLIDCVHGKWTFSDLRKYDNNLGFNGRIKDDGYCFDGSYHYGEVGRDLSLSTDYGFTNTFERIDNGVLRFEYGDTADEDTFVQLEELLKYCNTNGIYVVGYQAPFAPGVYDKMMQSGNYGYISDITPGCDRLFAEYGYEYFDYADATCIGVYDDYFPDGFHGSEVVYAMMVQDMISRGSRLVECVDCDRLNELIDNRYNSILLEYPLDTK